MSSTNIAQSVVGQLINGSVVAVAVKQRLPKEIYQAYAQSKETVSLLQATSRHIPLDKILVENQPKSSRKDARCPKQILIPPSRKFVQRAFHSEGIKKRALRTATTFRRVTSAVDKSAQSLCIPVREYPLFSSRIQVERTKVQEINNQIAMRQVKVEQGKKRAESSRFLRMQYSEKVRKNRDQTQMLLNHMQKSCNSGFTFDFDGELLLTNNSRRGRTKYPPRMEGKVQNEESNKVEINNPEKWLRRARGEQFKSMILQTNNLSRVSGIYDGNDAEKFMRRNDLFNNNHARQTSTKPYIRLNHGSVYTELTATN